MRHADRSFTSHPRFSAADPDCNVVSNRAHMTTLCMPLQHLPSRQHTVSKHDLIPAAAKPSRRRARRSSRSRSAFRTLNDEVDELTCQTHQNQAQRHDNRAKQLASCTTVTPKYTMSVPRRKRVERDTCCVCLTAWLHTARCCCKVQTQPNRGKTGPKNKNPRHEVGVTATHGRPGPYPYHQIHTHPTNWIDLNGDRWAEYTPR